MVLIRTPLHVARYVYNVNTMQDKSPAAERVTDPSSSARFPGQRFTKVYSECPAKLQMAFPILHVISSMIGHIANVISHVTSSMIGPIPNVISHVISSMIGHIPNVISHVISSMIGHIPNSGGGHIEVSSFILHQIWGRSELYIWRT